MTTNDTIENILHRRSVRVYKPDAVPPGALEAILQAGAAAPFGGPSRPFRLLVVRQRETKDRLLEAMKRGIRRAYGQQPEGGYSCLHFAQAPVVVAVLFRPTSMGDYPPRTEDCIGIASAACAIENMLLAAASLELGACWVGPLWEAKTDFEEVLAVQAPWEFLAFVAIGKPGEKHRRDKPRPMDEVVEFLD